MVIVAHNTATGKSSIPGEKGTKADIKSVVETRVPSVEQVARASSESATQLQHQVTPVAWRDLPTRPSTTPLRSILSLPRMSRHVPLFAWPRPHA
jgi:hypothetical protein